MNGVSVHDMVEFGTAIAAFLAALMGYFNNRRISQVAGQVHDVHIATNSLQDKLVAATKLAAMAEGVEIGRGQAAETSKR